MLKLCLCGRIVVIIIIIGISYKDIISCDLRVRSVIVSTRFKAFVTFGNCQINGSASCRYCTLYSVLRK